MTITKKTQIYQQVVYLSRSLNFNVYNYQKLYKNSIHILGI